MKKESQIAQKMVFDTSNQRSDTQRPNLNIQYISQGTTINEHINHIKKVCKAGGNWIQLRLKNVSLVDYLTAAKKCREICDCYGATLIINDNVGVAAESQADGVHVGLTDVNPKEARKQLGKHAIIGGTANTLANCIQHINDGVDYIGLGPFRYTTTKDKLSPILGLGGYQKIMDNLTQQGHQIPVLAIGGITINDIKALSKTGINGIAVSGLLSNGSVQKIEKEIKNIQNLNL